MRILDIQHCRRHLAITFKLTPGRWFSIKGGGGDESGDTRHTMKPTIQGELIEGRDLK